MKQAEQLCTQIRRAFADVPYPGDDNLYDYGQRDSDYYDVIRHLTGKHWQDVISELSNQIDSKTWLSKDILVCSPAAWHFFLPAHLITEILRGKINPFDLEPDLSERMGDYSERRFSSLNAEQCEVIIAYLEYGAVLLDEKQKKMPKYATHYEKQRQRLKVAQDWWKTRLNMLAKEVDEPP